MLVAKDVKTFQKALQSRAKEVIKEVWGACRSVPKGQKTVHEKVGVAVEDTIIKAMCKKSYDNVTVVIIGFDGFSQKISETIIPEPVKVKPQP